MLKEMEGEIQMMHLREKDFRRALMQKELELKNAMARKIVCDQDSQTDQIAVMSPTKPPMPVNKLSSFRGIFNPQ